MFWDAMICSGVAKSKAHTMYMAVRDHGPIWDENGEDVPRYSLFEDEENPDEW
jgi:hypothetical protein